MKEFIAQNGGLIPTVLVVCLIMNSCLSFLYVVLGKLRKMTENKVDDKCWKVIGAILKGLHKSTEILSANPSNR